MRDIDNLINNEKAFVVGGWQLTAQGQEWFRAAHVSPIMTDMYNRRHPEKLIRATASGTVNAISKRLGTLGLIEIEWRSLLDKPEVRPMRYFHLTEAAMDLAPALYVQHEMPLITDPEQLKEWLTLPLSQLALHDVPLPQIPAADIERTQSVS